MKSGYRLFAIDDEPSVLLIIQHYFKEKFDVKVFSKPADAIAVMHEGNLPDIIICDLNMPDINGSEFVEFIRSSGFFAEIPLIVLSATESSEKKIDILNLGADDFMVKPFNPKELEARINSILRRSGKLAMESING
ncbi:MULTISPECIES: response regulator transcription factor [Cyclobacterium]|uniref:Response regulator transcription factor n=1 Tax=Cyclobacterium plantarum TaxID=2716263 RepID=A0ABX0HBE5_9BACT|nr:MULTISPECIES: response regulator transcription factor [Cyclobacterium]MBD3629444.1 response regulator transcription factor [Cyclobacterium sp.]NHE58238.1 response regulator transcription factor [Cyclobacterium plantarum]